MSDVAIRATATASVPRDYTIPGAQEILPKSVAADMDGTTAASAWLPCLQVLDPGGAVMFSAVSPVTVAAGGSANVSWFPRVNGGLSSSGVSFVGARIYSSAAQTVATNTRTDITYDSIDVDTAGMVNLAADNRILTATVAGFYSVVARVDYLHSYLGLRACNIFLNGYYSVPSGTELGTDQTPIMSDQPQPCTAIALVYLNVGDFVSSGTKQTSGGNLTTAAVGAQAKYSHSFSAALIGV